ncbi:MAG TPA: DJ-1/PfpI family protein, partial [Cytophagales bacterium]|nr:DJ-1/PfpI family protein [Cytophagales bacterium]
MSKSFNVILFEDYTPLDVFGPVEVFSRLPESIKINFYSENGGAIKGGGNTQVETLPFFALRKSDILLIPGGWGIRREINKTSLKQQITEFALASEYVLAVCTGAALLAKCGVLDGLKATCNKLAFDWVQQQGEKVHWVNT